MAELIGQELISITINNRLVGAGRWADGQIIDTWAVLDHDPEESERIYCELETRLAAAGHAAAGQLQLIEDPS